MSIGKVNEISAGLFRAHLNVYVICLLFKTDKFIKLCFDILID